MKSLSKGERSQSNSHDRCHALYPHDIVDALFTCERIVEDEEAINALLEFKFLLIEKAPVREIIRSYFISRHCIERHNFLLAFRLRRWLETQFIVTVSAPSNPLSLRKRLDLGHPCYRRFEQSYRREFYENYLEINSFDEIEIRFTRS